MQRLEKTDVLVIGGGTAGFGAAVAAGRQGLDVTLLEATSKIGGVMAFCPGMPWGGGYPTDEIVGGLIEELTERLMAMSPPAAEKRACTLENFGPEIIYDHDIATMTMFEMLEEASVRVRLGAMALSPNMDGERIASVACCDRHGPFTIKPKIVIDCSGDGDISAKAGVPYVLGDVSGNMMAVTISFFMMGVDWTQAFADPDPYFRKYAAKGIAEGRLHKDLEMLYLMRGFHEGSVFCNSVHIRGVDGTDPVAVGAATQKGRRRCHQLAKFLQSDVPGFERAHMSMLSPTSGVRETRKLQGMYRLTGEDLARATKFEDGIVACDNPIDDVMRAEGDMTHDAAIEDGQYYTIPFRSLVPKEITNLMFAGRILSADSTAFASVRGMPQCMTMGQATGTAAAIAIELNQPTQRVSIAELVLQLSQQGINRLS
ncbi:FAD-dependent oxidoreductase [Pseudooctadecabacter jejudonensis]|uniref:Putative FAD-binding dehydrogenase n=1 Tax=Pseudooctadecabacter jejudonensis TaxID=1391910 RepID=A0A1Y5T6D8_9RHOB|nr:FAD-dependent oxidoreductase [Pseudooctadecabacter jejudonensis]SLN56808.1 putative FAD-binding dehydrogenase [Pseudooctadecabacter jejudonensis]